MKGPPTSFLAHVVRSVILNRQAHNLATVRRGAAMKWRDFHRIFRHRSHVRTMSNEVSRDLSPIEECRKMQRSESICGPAFRRGGIVLQDLQNSLRISGCRGFEYVELQFGAQKQIRN